MCPWYTHRRILSSNTFLESRYVFPYFSLPNSFWAHTQAMATFWNFCLKRNLRQILILGTKEQKTTLAKKRKEFSRSFIVWNLKTPKPSLMFIVITCFVKKFRDLSRMQYGQTIIGKYSSHFLATKQYKMAGAKFVSGTLKENCCQKTFTYFKSLKVILFQRILHTLLFSSD